MLASGATLAGAVEAADDAVAGAVGASVGERQPAGARPRESASAVRTGLTGRP